MSRKTNVVVEQVERKEVVAIKCDICGFHETSEENPFIEGRFASMTWCAGYGSKLDGMIFELDVCDNCMNKFGNKKGERKLFV